MHKTRISIGVVTIRERLQGLRRLLKSLHTQEYPKELIQIILVPNMDSREWALLSQALESEFLIGVQILEAHARVLGAARNEIIDCADGEVLLLLDDDCWIEDSRHLSRRSRLHELHPETVIGGYYNDDASVASDHFYNDLCNTWVEMDPQGWKCLGGNTSYPLEVLKNSGARFNDHHAYGGNENILNLKLWKQKIRFYKTRSVSVGHQDPSRFSKVLKKAVLQGRARAHEDRDAGDRPELRSLAKSLFDKVLKKKRPLKHLSYYLLGEIAYFSESLSETLTETLPESLRDRLKKPKINCNPVKQMVESAEEGQNQGHPKAHSFSLPSENPATENPAAQ